MDVNKISNTKYRLQCGYVHEYCWNMFICNMNSNIGYRIY